MVEMCYINTHVCQGFIISNKKYLSFNGKASLPRILILICSEKLPKQASMCMYSHMNRIKEKASTEKNVVPYVTCYLLNEFKCKGRPYCPIIKSESVTLHTPLPNCALASVI